MRTWSKSTATPVRALADSTQDLLTSGLNTGSAYVPATGAVLAAAASVLAFAGRGRRRQR